MENERNTIAAPAQDSWPLPNLPEEIIMQILLRLPVKSLLKFRCVSQSWRFLISSYNFAKAHIEVSTKNSKYADDRLIFGSRDLPVDLYTCSLRSIVEDVSSGSIYPMIDESLIVDRVWFDCPLCELHDVICQEGSCNGLVCLALSVSTLILWNPTTRKHRVLPESVKDLDLNFDYIEITFGFGYDELNDDYKVVEISYLERDTGVLETQVKVYSLRNDSWKTLSNWPGGRTIGGCGEFLNGAIHCSVSSFDGMDKCIIFSHDLATDTFREVPLPNIEDDDPRLVVKLLGGCLSVCCEHNTYMDVWVMKEYGVIGSWTKVVRIPFFVGLMENDFIRPSPLFLMVDGRILMNYGSNLRIYDPDNPQIHQFGDELEVEATTYFESLVSPDLEFWMTK